jgi:hypothetical protein
MIWKETVTIKLLPKLDLLLKESFPSSLERTKVKKSLLKKLEKYPSVKINVTNKTVIILTKDCRKVNNIKKYKNSPFPLLSNIEYFSNSIGE